MTGRTRKIFSPSLLSITCLALILAGNFAAAALPSKPVKKVFLLYSYQAVLPANLEWDEAIRAALEGSAAEPLEFYTEFLDLAQFPDKSYLQSLINFLQSKYADRKIDLLIPVGELAFDFLSAHGNILFPNVPIVFCAAEKHQVQSAKRLKNTTGVTFWIDIEGTLDAALKLHPQTQRVVLVGGTAKTDKTLEQLAREALGPYERRLEVIFLTDLPLAEILQRVAKLPPHTMVFYLCMYRDSAGNAFVPRDALALVAQAANAPVYGLWDTLLGHGIVGGHLMSLKTQGSMAGEIGLRVLNGEKPENIPIVYEGTDFYLFDWRQLKRWGLRESDLPPGSVVRFREDSFWQEYQRELSGIAAAFIFLGLLTIILLINLGRRRQAELKYRIVAEFTYDWEYWKNPDGTLRYVSPSCERISGYRPDDFIKRPELIREIIVPEDRDQWDRHNCDSQEEPGAREIQFRLQRPDGTSRWIEHACQPVTNDSGEFIGIRASNRDITAHKQGELEIARLKEQLQADYSYLEEEIKLTHNFEHIIGDSNELKYVLLKVEKVAPSDTTVLILGETGTGKELIARAIHSSSHRRHRPLIKVDCAALAPTLIESELFGHEKGAFTGAQSRKIGRFELAHGSTLFLDEIGELPLELQTKLLRVVQEGEFERLGSSQTLKVDVRLIAATNRDLEEEVRQGRFREDLWYRLNVFPLTVPPLRQRQGDIPLLAKNFVNQFARKMGKKITTIPPEVFNALQQYTWPGNIRELENILERAVIHTTGPVLQLSERINESRTSPEPSSQSLEAVERAHILHVLDQVGWKIEGKNGAAARLELNPGTLRSRLRKLGIVRNP